MALGEFSKKVRRSVIKGPNQRGFNRADWEALSDAPSLDEKDKHLLSAGLLFDDFGDALVSIIFGVHQHILACLTLYWRGTATSVETF